MGMLQNDTILQAMLTNINFLSFNDLCVNFVADIVIMFSEATFNFDENVDGGMGYVEIVSNVVPQQDFTFNVNGGRCGSSRCGQHGSV